MKKTKIICTVGPGTDKPGILEQMMRAGMNVARFNFSHGSQEDHGGRMEMARAAARKAGRPVALMLDTKGPEMRLGKFAAGEAKLTMGGKFTLTARQVEGAADIVSISHKLLPQEVRPGDKILLSDGLIALRVDEIKGEDILTTILNSGEISTGKRIAAPGVAVKLPFLSEQDRRDILFGAKCDMDFVAASFVQRAADILAIRAVLESVGAKMDIIAKIENAEGVNNIDEILKVADGVMVARGDLGVEIPTEDVPVVQKMIIDKCNKAGKPVITATQMLESMMINPRPTRAEASDIANAIMDGTDAIMLSGETASGKYPVEAVQMMNKIAVRTETALNYALLLTAKGFSPYATSTDAISHATVQVAQELKAAAIITVSESGYTPRMVSKYRPGAQIIAVTQHEKTVRRVQLLWGVEAVVCEEFTNSDDMVPVVVGSALKAGILQEGELVVISAGVPIGKAGTTNMLRLHLVGNVLARGTAVGRGTATGRVCIARTAADIEAKFQAGDVLVVRSVTDETARYAAKAAAIITEEDGLTSPGAVVGVSYGIPVLIGVKNATEKLEDRTEVTVDAVRGSVYQGKMNAL